MESGGSAKKRILLDNEEDKRSSLQQHTSVEDQKDKLQCWEVVHL